MRCADVQEKLIDLLYSELGDEDRAAVSAHLERCPECGAAWGDVRGIASALDRWTTPPAPGIAERVLATLAIREAEAARVGVGRGVLHLLAFLLAGSAAAGVSLLLLGGGSHAEDTPLKVGLAGVVWTALYTGAGFLTQHGRYRRLALAALIAAGLSVLLAPVLSMPAVVEACRRWLEAPQGSVALNVVLLLAGAAYASTPVFLSGAIITRAQPAGIASEAVRLAGAYGLLIGPSVYLQCQTLTLSLLAPWLAGLLLGSFLGSAGGVAAAFRLRPVSA